MPKTFLDRAPKKLNFERVPRNFASNFELKIAGILYVFQDFYKQKLEQKGGHFAEREFLEVPSS